MADEILSLLGRENFSIKLFFNKMFEHNAKLWPWPVAHGFEMVAADQRTCPRRLVTYSDTAF